MERLKTYLLTILVTASIIMSYVLAFEQPGFEALQQNKDVESNWTGDTQATAQVLAPRKMVLHAEGQKVYMSYFKQAGYTDIWNKLSEVPFSNLTEGHFDAATIRAWREKAVGFECVFDATLPISAIRSRLQFPDTFTDGGQYVDRIWVYTRDGMNVARAVFLNDADNSGIVASLAVSARELKELVAKAAKGAGPSYTWSAYNVYLPDAPIAASQTTHTYSIASATQLEASLFIEPGSVRKLLDQGGREIYTDGQRGLKIERNMNWMIFNNPISTNASSSDWMRSLNTAVQFVNLHGGWDGTNLLSHSPTYADASFGFRQYVNAYPVVTQTAPDRADISILLRNDIASNFERSLTDADLSVAQSTTSMRLSNAADIIANNKDVLKATKLADVYPVYEKSYVNDTAVAFTPKWAAESVDGQIIILK